MADAAVEFLLENLKQLLLHHSNLIKGAKDQLEKLENDLRLLKAFLKDSTKKRIKDEKTRELVCQIRDVVYEAEDIIDTFMIQAAKVNSKNYFLRAFMKPLNIRGVAEKVESVVGKVNHIYGNMSRFDFKLEDERPEATEAPRPRKDKIVGFEKEAEKLMGYLNEETEQLEVISIIGMPGLGKTTLAGKIFRDPVIRHRFDTCIWVYVPQEFTKKDIFLAILRQMKTIPEEEYDKRSAEELAQEVARGLDRKNFLIVMDDVWTKNDWDELRIALPKTNKMGKVLITSRQVEVGRYTNRVRDPYILRLLSSEESWLLLQWEVFGKPEVPSGLEDIGKRIANSCGGLPLAIVVIAGILVTKNKASFTTWERVSRSVTSYLHEDPHRPMEKIISLSYEKLPYQLRDCFLYLGMFPEDFEIPVWNLIRMWIVEGLIRHKDDMSLIETAENNLDDLINRNLVMAEKFKRSGKVKTCRLHDMIRDFCKTQAGNERENFFLEIRKSSDGGFQPPVPDELKTRRLCIHSDVLKFLSEKPCSPRVRSFVCFSKDEIDLPRDLISSIPAGFKLLRVLDAMPLRFSKLPRDMYQLLHLRYIALSIDSKVLPAAFSILWNIQTLIVHTTYPILDIRVDILNMTQLRDFKTNKPAILLKTGKSSKGGENIQTLRQISPKSCTKEVFERAQNLKKLGVRGSLAPLLEDKNGSFDSFGKLRSLEKLKLLNLRGNVCGLPPAYKFPAKLRTLTLCYTHLDWHLMSVLGSLENLQVLKLKDGAFMGKFWKATDGGFRKLQVLHIRWTDLENWVASHHHFPRLKCLKLHSCYNLRNIPIGIADIPNFQLLDLYYSQDAVASAKQIHEAKRKQEDQQSADVLRFKLSIFPPEE